MENMQKMSVNVRKEIHKALKEESKQRGLSLNTVVSLALEEYVKNKSKN